MSLRLVSAASSVSYFHSVRVPNFHLLVHAERDEHAVVIRIPEQRADIVRVMVSIGISIDLKDDWMRGDEIRRKHVMTADMPIGTTGEQTREDM